MSEAERSITGNLKELIRLITATQQPKHESSPSSQITQHGAIALAVAHALTIWMAALPVAVS
jgi:hypothetical protein